MLTIFHFFSFSIYWMKVWYLTFFMSRMMNRFSLKLTQKFIINIYYLGDFTKSCIASSILSISSWIFQNKIVFWFPAWTSSSAIKRTIVAHFWIIFLIFFLIFETSCLVFIFFIFGFFPYYNLHFHFWDFFLSVNFIKIWN